MQESIKESCWPSVTCYFLKGKLRRMAEAERDGFDLLDLYIYIVEQDIQNNTLLPKKANKKKAETFVVYDDEFIYWGKISK